MTSTAHNVTTVVNKARSYESPKHVVFVSASNEHHLVNNARPIFCSQIHITFVTALSPENLEAAQMRQVVCPPGPITPGVKCKQ